MGLFKRCPHKGRNRDRCEHPWWRSVTYRGRIHRQSLPKWSNEHIATKQQAEAIYLRFREAVRSGALNEHQTKPSVEPLTFDALADLYLTHYVQAKNLGSADTIGYRLRRVRARFAGKLVADISVRDVEALVATLKQPGLMCRTHSRTKVRRPATINRYLSLLQHIFNWALERDYIRATPFRRNAVALVKQEREDNLRHRRIGSEEEDALLRAAPSHLRPSDRFRA